ncbi:MAG TPA: DNA recombination protein RmuC, partial [Burkholderiaceae bacterium]|nr:DNA recombination protein RmuC [Burkholderiaceae bacterium]
MIEVEFIVGALAGALLIALLAILLLVRRPANPAALEELRHRMEENSERLERELRAAVDTSATQTRVETGARLSEVQTGLASHVASLANVQTTQLNGLGQQVATHLAEVRQTLETRLQTLQQGNETKLDQMRATVEEKLQTTLEARLGESFRIVSDRLEQVHRGLGEMQSLAVGVGDLKRVLSNVKSRGTFGEVQLAVLLEQVLAPDQYATNVTTRPGTKERVEFAIKYPGKNDGQPVWLPIDAKFPSEDYERLLNAQERADPIGVDEAGRALEQRIRLEAKSIREKYVEVPHTTDFAILFLPTEGLFAEVLRRPGLVEALNRELRVVIAGPTTLFAILNSLQMGFRTLALEQRSAEVWQVLGAVKTEFAKFGEVLAKLRGQLETATNTIEAAETRTRQLGRALKTVEAMPAEQAARLLPQRELD